MKELPSKYKFEKKFSDGSQILLDFHNRIKIVLNNSILNSECLNIIRENRNSEVHINYSGSVSKFNELLMFLTFSNIHNLVILNLDLNFQIKNLTLKIIL